MTVSDLINLIENYCLSCRGTHNAVESCDSETLGRCSLYQSHWKLRRRDELYTAILKHCEECLGPDGERGNDCNDCGLKEIWNWIPA